MDELAIFGEDEVADAASGAEVVLASAAVGLASTIEREQLLEEVGEIRGVFDWHRSLELDEADFRNFRLLHGLYTQRQPGLYTARVRVPFGRLTAAQLRRMSEVAEEFGNGEARVTTRQNVELHDIAEEGVGEAVEALAGAGLTTRETGGNVVQNTTANPLAGVDMNEVFDVTPYAEAIYRHFLRNEISQHLPRKLKIAFGSHDRDAALAAVNDIALIAVKRAYNGVEEMGFEMRVGGGLGASPEAAHVLFPFVPLDQVLPTTEAVVRVFDRKGDHSHRARARLKFLIRQVGIDQFRRWVMELPQALSQRMEVPVPPALRLGHNPGPDCAYDLLYDLELIDWRWERQHVIAQKQPGYLAVLVHLPQGILTAAQGRALAAACERWGDGETRTTPQQNILLRWVPIENLLHLYADLKTAGLAHPLGGTITDIVSCAGSKFCRMAVTSSGGLAEALSEVLQREAGAEDLANATIRISGCPNSCGHHHTATIGFFGAMRKVDGQQVPCYQLLIGGSLDGLSPSFARPVARYPARRVPLVLQRIIEVYRAQRRAGESLVRYLRRADEEWLRDQLLDLETTPTTPDDALFFVDWGETRLYRLRVTDSECAGV